MNIICTVLTQCRAVLLVLGQFAAAMVASAAIAEAVPRHIQMEIPQAQLLGAGTYSWFGLKIYDARLWVGAGGYQPATAKFALDLQYARKLDGVQIADASVKEMRRMGLGTPQQHQVWLTKMNGLFLDVKDGTHITGVYLPEQGARFYLNGEMLGEVPDPDFARAFFAIWLDPKTSDRKLRGALLADYKYQ